MRTGWSVRNIYLYLVCFATLMMVIGGMIATLNSIAQLALPPYRWEPGPLDIHRQAKERRISEEEMRLELQRDSERQAAAERANRKREVLRSAIFVLIAGPVYLFHWRQVLAGGGAD